MQIEEKKNTFKRFGLDRFGLLIISIERIQNHMLMMFEE